MGTFSQWNGHDALSFVLCPLSFFVSFGAFLFFGVRVVLLFFHRGSLPLALHEEAFNCLICSVGQLGGGLPCSVDPRIWLLDELVTNIKERRSVVQVSTIPLFLVGNPDVVARELACEDTGGGVVEQELSRAYLSRVVRCACKW